MNTSFAQIGQQLLATWKQLGLNQRISIVLASTVVLVGLGSLVFWSARQDYGLLYGNLEDTEAAKVVSALDENKVPYRIGKNGRSIYVPTDKVHVMRMQLASRGIPRGEGVGFEIFDKPNFGISDFVQRANYLRAVQGELARTISQLDEVEASRVMIVMPENRLLIDNQKRPTASVFIKVQGNTRLDAQAVSSIRFLVANAVEGLQPSSVTVVDNHGNVLSEIGDEDSMAGLSSSQLAARRNLEHYLAQKAEGMLEAVLGPGQAVVRVSADINYDTLSRVEEKYDPDGQVLRSSTINDEKTDTLAGTGGGGLVGVSINASTAETNFASSGPVNNNRLTKKTTENQYELSRVTSNLVQASGGIKHLSAAVFVAAKTEAGTNGVRQIVPRKTQELEKLQRIVQSALGIQTGSDQTRQDEITLEEIPFNDQPIVELTKQLDRQEQHELWWRLAKQVGYPVLGVAMLLLFWRSLKRTNAESIPIGVPLGNGALHGNGRGNGNGHGGHFPAPDWPKAPGGGMVTVEVLNQLIRENPGNMTQAIRTWMNRGKP